MGLGFAALWLLALLGEWPWLLLFFVEGRLDAGSLLRGEGGEGAGGTVGWVLAGTVGGCGEVTGLLKLLLLLSSREGGSEAAAWGREGDSWWHYY